jgi:hypothetical protein
MFFYASLSASLKNATKAPVKAPAQTAPVQGNNK